MSASETPIITAPETSRAAADSVLRLSGHLRIAASGISLAFKLAILLVLWQMWGSLNYTIAWSDTIWQECWLLGITMFSTVFMVRLLAAPGCGVLVTIASFCVYTTWLAVSVQQILLSYALYGLVNKGQQFSWMADGPLLLLAMVVGAIAGYLLFNLTWAAVGKIGRAPAVKGLVPTFGHDPGDEYRPELNDALLRAFTGYASLLSAVRMLLIAVIGLILLLGSFAWAKESIRRLGSTTMHWWSNGDDTLWLLGSCAVTVILATALLPLGKRKSCIGISLGIFICMTLGAAGALLIARQPLIGCLAALLIILASAAVALPTCAATQFIVGFIIRRILPAPLRRPLLPAEIGDDDYVEAPDAYRAALCCEECGYSLKGLPVNRCNACTVEVLRCPECGHQQPAGTLHARAIASAHKLHSVLRALGRLGSLGLVLLVVLGCVSLGVAVGNNSLFGRASWREIAGATLVLMLYMFPLRLLLLRWRPLWLASLVVAVTPPAMFALGAGYNPNIVADSWDNLMLLPGCVLGAFAAPLLWRGCLVLLFGNAGTGAYRWHTGPTYQHSSALVVAGDADRVAGRELPLRCNACHADWSDMGTAACSVCGVTSGVCPWCASPTPISAVRVGFENMVYRARQMSLAIIAGILLFVATICAAALAIGGLRDSYQMDADILSVVVISLIWGSLLRVALIRRSSLFAVVASVISHIALFFLIPLLMEDVAAFSGDVYYFMAVLAGTAAATLGAIIAAPLLHLLAMGLLPTRNALALMAFLRGRMTLDEAAGQLL